MWDSHPVVVDSADALAKLRRSRQKRRFQVAIRGLSEAENAAWQARMERDYFACGCSEGAAAIAVGFVAFAAWTYFSVTPVQWWDLPRGFLAMVATGTIGKVAGLLRARVRFRRTSKDLAVLLRGRQLERPRQAGDAWSPT